MRRDSRSADGTLSALGAEGRAACPPRCKGASQQPIHSLSLHAVADPAQWWSRVCSPRFASLGPAVSTPRSEEITSLRRLAVVFCYRQVNKKVERVEWVVSEREGWAPYPPRQWRAGFPSGHARPTGAHSGRHRLLPTAWHCHHPRGFNRSRPFRREATGSRGGRPPGRGSTHWRRTLSFSPRCCLEVHRKAPRPLFLRAAATNSARCANALFFR
jgi:hypothetical protein